MKSNSQITCHCCHLNMVLPEHPTGDLACARCGSRLEHRKPASISRTWALLIASVLFYIPANVLPMTRTTFLGGVQDDTILSGVIYFINSGSWHVALIIFVASVVVPLAKILILAYLLISVQKGSTRRCYDRTRMYRFTHLIGRWSMVDLYVVAVIASLVQLGALSQVDPGPAAFFFTAVVVLTIVAAETFDPRLIWDPLENRHAP